MEGDEDKWAFWKQPYEEYAQELFWPTCIVVFKIGYYNLMLSSNTTKLLLVAITASS